MQKQDKRTLDEIVIQMYYGNWGCARDEYVKLNCTPQEFQEYLEEISTKYAGKSKLLDLALLGFYTRKDRK